MQGYMYFMLVWCSILQEEIWHQTNLSAQAPSFRRAQLDRLRLRQIHEQRGHQKLILQTHDHPSQQSKPHQDPPLMTRWGRSQWQSGGQDYRGHIRCQVAHTRRLDLVDLNAKIGQSTPQCLFLLRLGVFKKKGMRKDGNNGVEFCRMLPKHIPCPFPFCDHFQHF